MISHFPSPILSVAADVVKDLEGEDALCTLWALFTKCKESLKDGRRLENISWRLWYREMASAQTTPSSSPGSLSPSFSEKRSPSPITPVSEDGLVTPQVPLPHPSLTPSTDIAAAHSWHAQHSATTVMTAGRRLSTASAPMERRKSNSSVGVGKMILDILPCKVDVNSEKEKAARSPTVPRIAQPRPVVATLPTVQLPATPPQPGGPSFPRVVVVNPTPHPTPPATPSNSHPPTMAAQPSLHLLPPPPARSLLSASIAAASSVSTKPPSPAKAVSPPQVKQPTAPASTQSKAASHDGIQPASSKSKPYNDDTLKASDRRFFLQDGGSPSPERAPSNAESRSEMNEEQQDQDQDQDQEQDEHSPSSGTSSHMKSEATGVTSATGGGGGAKRSRVQARKSKERHAPTRPALQRLHSHGLRQTSQKKVVVADAKKTTFNIGSVSSNGSRSGKSSKAPDKDKEKKGESSRTRPSSPAPAPAPAKQTSTQANAAAKANGAGPSQQRRGIVISTSSEYETTDTDDDSEWASEDSAEDRPKNRKAEAEEARLRQAAEEAQRQRDMFAKVPKRSYSNLNRTRSGLLSQLLNPDPSIFPPNHPYRASRSTQDMTQWGRQGAGTMLQMSKSSAAVPLAAQVTAQAPVLPADNARQGGYRPKGRPQEQEMEDTESDEENPDDTIQVSRSLAQQKLAALADPNRRRHSDRSLLSQQQPAQVKQTTMQEARPHLPTVNTAPIPLNHPYNLPAPAPPMTPRTTRRQMLQTELSESLRRNLLWERQVSRINMTGRRVGVLGNGLRPLTAMNGDGPAMAQQQPHGQGQQQQQQQAQNGDDTEERRRRAMARNRSWADEYHYSGW
ncbi:hypothetical protein C8Q76DRAFT_696311 [Earliella scabrosa]|nr:hypothetical protein C8Q76DRAFT_696311 [Earliella scabrosa]